MYKELLCHNAWIFKKRGDKKQARISITSHTNKRSAVQKRRKSQYLIRNIANKEHDMELIMKNNLESKADIYRFFISKNVSPMLKCKFMVS